MALTPAGDDGQQRTPPPSAAPDPAQGQLPFDGGAGGAPEAPSTPVAPPSFAAAVREAGFELPEDADDLSASQRVLDAYRVRQAQTEELASRLQEQARIAEYYRTLAQNPQQAQQPAQTQAKPERFWNPPQIDEGAVARYRTVDATGNPAWREDTPIAVREQAERYAAYVENWQNQLLRSPDKALAPLVEQIVGERVSAELRRHEEERSRQAFYSDLPRQAPWIFARDPATGAQMRDPVNGGVVLTPAGQQALNIATELAESGLSDDRAWMFAMRMVQQPAQQQSLSNSREDAQRRLLERGQGVTPNRTGTFPRQDGGTSQPAQNQRLTFEERLRRNLRESGITGTGGQIPTG